MAFIPAANCVQAEMIFTWESQVVENVYHYLFDHDPITDDMFDLAAFLKAWWDTNLKTGCPSNVSLTQVKCTNLTTISSEVLNYSSGLPLTGSSVSQSLPNNCTCVLTKRTFSRGRSFRGRVYHVGLTESQVTNSALVSGYGATLVGVYNQIMLPSINTDFVPMVVLSRFSEGAPRPTGVMTQVVNFTTDAVIDSQRKRLPGRGA